jgi:pyruvate dehydrogenase E2 component (dihydrolipoamide acetyltransferase)
MTLHAISIPKWGLAMEEGTLTSWLVAEGDAISKGTEIVEVETSKIANVIEAPADGLLRRRVASEGDTKPVGALLGVLSDADEDDAAIDAFVAEYEARFDAGDIAASAAPEPRRLEIDGRKIRYLLVEDEDARSGSTPVLLLHGFGGDLLNWMFNQSELAKDRAAYALELPGHGSSSKDVGEGTFAWLAKQVVAAMDELDLRKVHLVGHSMGAAVALAVAQSVPARVKSLVAICGVGFGGTVNPAYVEGFIAAQKSRDMKGVAQMLFANADMVTREMVDDMVSYKRLDDVQAALRTLADKALSPDSIATISAFASELSIPTLGIFGAEDKVVPTPKPSISNSVILPATGHMAHMEQASSVNTQIAEFLASND